MATPYDFIHICSFNVTSQFAVALNAKFHVIHILKKYNFYHPDFFSLIYIFCVAMTSKNHKVKWGVTVPVSSQNDNKGTILASNDRFARGDRGDFQDKHPFSRLVIKIAIKSIGTTIGALVTSFLATIENRCHRALKSQCYIHLVMRSTKQGDYLESMFHS